MNGLVTATNLTYITAVLAVASFVVYMIRKQETNKKIASNQLLSDELNILSQHDVPEIDKETRQLPHFPNIPQEVFDFYDMQREELTNPNLTGKNSPALNKTELLILWLLKNGKADGKIKRKGKVSAFDQDWDLDLILDLDKTKQTQQKKVLPESESKGETLLF